MMDAQKLLTLGQQIIVARQTGADVAELPQQWSDALRKAVTERSVNGEELDILTDFEYVVWNHPAAERIATIGTAVNEAYRRDDKQQVKELYRERAEVLTQHATWYQIKDQKLHV